MGRGEEGRRRRGGEGRGRKRRGSGVGHHKPGEGGDRRAGCRKSTLQAGLIFPPAPFLQGVGRGRVGGGGGEDVVN